MDRITEHVDRAKHPTAGELEDNVRFLAARLKEARELIGKAPIVIEYDNGGGQRGTRKNPAYEAYAQLFNAFITGMRALDAMLEDAQPTTPAAVMSLESLRVQVNDKLKVAK